jgi:Ca-activated chloride channel family protein
METSLSPLFLPRQVTGASPTSICGSSFVWFAPHRLSFVSIRHLLAWIFAFSLYSEISALAQIPAMNAGPDSGFAQIDFAQMYLDQVNRHAKESEKQRLQDKELVDSGVVSALDLDAPNNAVEEFNRGNSLLKAQNSKEAMRHLQRAIGDYPKFVSAHIGLGLAYLDQDDTGRAKSEFETAARLDSKFPRSFLNLGQMALSLKDFSTAQTELEQAVSLSPKDARILSALVYAQNGNHQYQQALETAHRVHALNHKGMANVHYVAASAAMSVHDLDTIESELNLFLSEDPTNAFAPNARQNLAILTHNRIVRATEASNQQQTIPTSISQRLQTFPNSEKLKAQLTALGDESEIGTCEDCGASAELDTPPEGGHNGAGSIVPSGVSSPATGVWTIRKSVDQVAVFFSVSSHGRMVNDLEASDIQIRDDNKPPERVLQFSPQSKLPLRLALLVDTSGSVRDRFSFEKHAATAFVQKVLSSTSDLGFIAGFSRETTVTQDFSGDPAELGRGIEQLTNGGGTALFDAVLLACSKLAEYPESERVARVLVILSDGEDNSSHSSLKQSIQAAERTGVTIYTVSTREDGGDKTDADKVLEVLAEGSGGEAFFPGDMLTLGKSFDKLRELIRSRYFIAYKPADFLPNGSYRPIRIIAEKDGKHLQVRARKGYHARLETGPN